MLLEDALRQRAERGAAIGADTLVDRVRAELAGSEQARSTLTLVPRRRAVLVFAAAFALVIAAISLVLLFPSQPADDPAVTTTVRRRCS